MTNTTRAKHRLSDRRKKATVVSLLVAPLVGFVVLKVLGSNPEMEIEWFYAIAAAVFSVWVIFGLFGASEPKELTCSRCGSVKVRRVRDDSTISPGGDRMSWDEDVMCQECSHRWQVHVESWRG